MAAVSPTSEDKLAAPEAMESADATVCATVFATVYAPVAPTVEPASRREIWGWYWWDFAANAFYSVALPVFFPLLLTTLANMQAYAELGQSAVPDCSTSGAAPCLVCVPGEGTQLNSTAGLQPYPQPKVTAGGLHIDPAAYATIMAGMAVLLQVFCFISVGPIADYGRGRKNMLVAGTVFGAVMLVLCLTLVSPSVWWLAGIYLILANTSFGLACVSFNSYLAVLVDASPEVLDSSASGCSKSEILAVREKVSNQVSLTGVGWGSLGAIIAIVICAGLTMTTSDPSLQLRLATAASGVFWLSFSFLTFLWLKPRPGPPFPAQGIPLLSGWQRIWSLILQAKAYRNAFLFLVCYFVYADGYITLTQIGVLYGQRMLCMDNIQLILLVASVSFFAGIGALVFYWVQRWTRLNNKAMLVLGLTLMVPLPLWGLLGYLTAPGSVGLKHMWEVFVFACWFGFALGPVLSYNRTVFIDMIPVGTEATFFSLYSITDKGSSWLGPLFTALVVQATGDLRPTFWYILVVMVVPLLMLIFFVNHKEGMAQAGRVKDSHEESSEEGIVSP